MKGLFKSNFLAVWTNAKIFLLFMFAMGIAVIIIPDQTWQMYFIIIGIVGLAVNAATVIGNEFSSKWGKYKLTLPVKRIDIVKSLYINQLLWIMIGVLFVGIIIALSYLLHGITFEQFEGISGVLVIGISQVHRKAFHSLQYSWEPDRLSSRPPIKSITLSCHILK